MNKFKEFAESVLNEGKTGISDTVAVTWLAKDGKSEKEIKDILKKVKGPTSGYYYADDIKKHIDDLSKLNEDNEVVTESVENIEFVDMLVKNKTVLDVAIYTKTTDVTTTLFGAVIKKGQAGTYYISNAKGKKTFESSIFVNAIQSVTDPNGYGTGSVTIFLKDGTEIILADQSLGSNFQL